MVVILHLMFIGGDYVIVDFSLNCMYSCYKWYNVDISVYLHVFVISCPCYNCNEKYIVMSYFVMYYAY